MADGELTAQAWLELTSRIGDEAEMATFRQMMHAFRFATLAWETSHEEGDGGMLKAGAYALYYIRNASEIKRITGLARADVVAKMQATSDWLERHGWCGIHYFAGMGQGRVLVRETARKMDMDMVAIHDAAARLLREAKKPKDKECE